MHDLKAVAVDHGAIVATADVGSEYRIDHDARWRFDPKKQHLSPLNGEATALSQQDDIGSTLLPRLRAVAPEPPDSSRFDSAAFDFQGEEGSAPDPVVPVEPTPSGRIR